MNEQRFDELVTSLIVPRTRRGVFHLAAAALALLAAPISVAAGKKKSGKKGKKKSGKKRKGTKGCSQEEAQYCREDYADICSSYLDGAEADECLAYYTTCCDLYAACEFGAAEACEDDGP
jgi:hypothetical protein